MTKCHSLVHTAVLTTLQSHQLACIKMAKALHSKVLWHGKSITLEFVQLPFCFLIFYRNYLIKTCVLFKNVAVNNYQVVLEQNPFWVCHVFSKCMKWNILLHWSLPV